MAVCYLVAQIAIAPLAAGSAPPEDNERPQLFCHSPFGCRLSPDCLFTPDPGTTFQSVFPS